jgi:hypothetical protein
MLRSDSEAQRPASTASTAREPEVELSGPTGGRLPALRGVAACASLTEQVAARLEAAASALPSEVAPVLRQHARKLRRCIERTEREHAGRVLRDRVSPPCRHALCPACQATNAKRLQSQLTRQLRETASAERRHVRLSVVETSGLSQAHHVLCDAFAQLRRSVRWRAAVAGGVAFIDLLDQASAGAATAWNPHAHVVVELLAGKQLRPRELTAWWAELLTARGESGSTYVGPMYAVPVERDRRFKLERSPQAYYVTRRARGEQLLSLDDERLAAAALALPGLRLVTWFGTWRGLPWRGPKRSRKRSP